MKNATTASLPLVLALLGGTALITPTGETQRRIRLAHHTALNRVSIPLSPAEQALAEEKCPHGLPERDPGWIFGPTLLVARPGYALEHSSGDKIPLWVCEYVELADITGNAKRRDKFEADPKLPPGQRAELDDYKGTRYDRGHMAPAANQKKSQNRNDETFFLSNMAPQVGVGFNRHKWEQLESLTREWVRTGVVTAAWIITGPIFWDQDEESVATADGFIEHPVIGENAVSVPTHFYKIVVGKTAGEKLIAVAFVMENRAHPNSAPLTDFIASIDWIEERTGLNFMPKLDAETEGLLERQKGVMFD